MIKEINETTASVVLEYQLTSQNEDEETDYMTKRILQNEISGYQDLSAGFPAFCKSGL